MPPTGYEPLDTPKPVADGLWVIDGPAVRSFGFPFSTRATVVRLENGDLWVHSPTRLTDGLRAAMDALGPVAHVVAPNQIHFLGVNDWLKAYPEAVFWAAPGVHARAEKNNLRLPPARPLHDTEAEQPWAGQMTQMIVRGSSWHREAVFFHETSATLILTDLIEAFETAKLPVHCRPFVWLNGIDDSDGKMPPLIRRTFRDKDALAEDVERMIAWGPRRVILAHGRWYQQGGVAELERAFRKILQARRWERAYDAYQTRDKDG